MCKLGDKIYRCTESLPEGDMCIQLDPEGVFQLMVVSYDMEEDLFSHNSLSVNFCPKCGSNLYTRGFRTLEESRKNRNYDKFSTPIGERKYKTI